MGRQPPQPARKSKPCADVFRPWLLGALVALEVARPLLPSEGAITSGDSLIFVFLPLLLAAVWALRAAMRWDTQARFGAVDVAVVSLVAWHGIAAVVAARTGNPRAAINSAWQWAATGVMFFLARQLVVSARELRAVAAVMIALATSLSAFGFHQFFVTIPRDQAHYAADPEGALKEAGVVAPPGSRQRLLFEKRVNSSEPMATFALANSLAGFLTPWLIVAVGIVATAFVTGRRDAARWLPAALCGSAILACLILTKSRAAIVGSALGVSLLVLWSLAAGAHLTRRFVLVAAAIVLLLAGGAVAVGALDRQVVSEAGKSLGYRLQYWQATALMIRDNPWFGCGPGQFQTTYTAYKLPEASEVVADPHNFLLEVWGTAGTPAAVALILIIVIIGSRALRAIWRGMLQKSLDDDQFAGAAVAEKNARMSRSSTRRSDPAASRAAWWSLVAEDDATWHILAGAATGFLLATLLGPLAIVPLGLAACGGGILVGSLALAVQFPWISRGVLSAASLASAACALIVNLLAGGGINYASVAWSLWLLLALVLAAVEPWRPLPRLASGLVLVVLLTLGACFYITAYQPTMTCNLSLDRADSEPERADLYLREAAVADPLNSEPPRRLAVHAWRHWQEYPSESAVRRFLAYIDEALRLDPRSAPLAEQKADCLIEVFRSTGDRSALSLAIESYERALSLYPTSIVAHAKFALALAQSNQPGAAVREAREALKLNEETPHADQKLPADMTARLQLLVEGRIEEGGPDN